MPADAVRALVQRVSTASVVIDGVSVAEISAGLLVFVGLFPDDDMGQIQRMAEKVVGLRIFPDGHKPMNASVMDVAGEILIVSQFTLAADTSRGKRPGFSGAAPPEVARKMYKEFVAAVGELYPKVSTGEFGADMQVSLVNDGPVTLLLET